MTRQMEDKTILYVVCVCRKPFIELKKEALLIFCIRIIHLPFLASSCIMMCVVGVLSFSNGAVILLTKIDEMMKKKKDTRHSIQGVSKLQKIANMIT